MNHIRSLHQEDPSSQVRLRVPQGQSNLSSTHARFESGRLSLLGAYSGKRVFERERLY
jgi:hypothetical protein